MSRRDTIIVAVLLNTGLLAVLFMMAMTPEDPALLNEQYQIATAPLPQREEKRAPAVEPEPVAVTLAHEAAIDEVDTVLKDFAATLQADTLVVQEENKELLAYSTPSAAPSKTEWEEKPQYVEVTVKNGDILGRIAQANGTTVGAIKKANNLASDTLKVGQQLRIPVGSRKEAKKKEPAPADNDVSFSYYIIQSGDNPWKIAKKFNVSVSELLRLNDLDEARARNLKPGDRVRVR